MKLATLLGASALLGTTIATSPFGRSSEITRNRGRVDPRLLSSQDLSKRDYNSSSFRYLTPQTEKYQVTSLPDFHFDLGEMYSGSIPVSNGSYGANETSLFFVFQPKLGDPVDEITIWLNGGPGCSSLEGFLQENGRWTWQSGTYLPTENPYSWVNLTNMLWVEQPFGTGFAQGPVTATTQEEIAADFVSFFRNFQTAFGISNYKIYVTGESYAGRYVPYIASAMIDQNDATHFNVSGGLIYDPSIGADYLSEQATVVPFVNANSEMFGFNETFMRQINELHRSCGYEEYLSKWFVFPAAGTQPDVSNLNLTDECDVFDAVFIAALTNNPCFDIYEVNTQCPLLWDVLSFPTALEYVPEGANTYFNRPDVKTALHAPQSVEWTICSNEPVLRTDTSAMSIEAAIPHVVETTNRFLISHGSYDMVLITNGTLASIQNMTWNGAKGFTERPEEPIVIDLPDLQYGALFAENGLEGVGDQGQGLMGVQRFERGLMWAETYLSGHMQPGYQPRVTYRHLEWVLGRREKI